MCVKCLGDIQLSCPNFKMPFEANWDCMAYKNELLSRNLNEDEFLPLSSSSEDEEELYRPLNQSSDSGDSFLKTLGLESLLAGDDGYLDKFKCDLSELFSPYNLDLTMSEYKKTDRGKRKREKESENIEADHAYCTPPPTPPQSTHTWCSPEPTHLTSSQSTLLTSSQPTQLTSSQSTHLTSSQSTKLTVSQSTKLTVSQSTKLTGSQSTRLTPSQPKHTRLTPPASPVKLIKTDDKSYKRQQKAAKERARRDYSKKILQRSEKILRMVNAPELQKKVTKKLIVQSAKRITDQGYKELREQLLKTWQKVKESTNPSAQADMEELKRIIKDRAIVL